MEVQSLVKPTERCICMYYGSPLAAAKAAGCNSPCGPAKLRQLFNLHSLQNSQHTKCVPSGPYATTTYLQHKIACVRVCIVRMLSCVCMHVSVPMFVLLHSPRCTIRCSFAKSVQSCHQGKGWLLWRISYIKYILICFNTFLVITWFHVLFNSFNVFIIILQCRK